MTDHRQPFALLADYTTSAVQAPISWAAAVGAIILKALTPTPELGAALVALIAIWLIDFVLGLAASVKSGRPITSKRMGDGLWKLLAYLSLPAAVSLLMLVARTDAAFFEWVKWAMIGACVGREFLSILEKSVELGVNLPEGLVSLLKGKIHDLTDPKRDQAEEKP